MLSTEVFSINAHHLLVVASVGLILITFVIWQLYYVRGRGNAELILSDGSVLIISDGVVKQASSSAKEILGECENQPVVRLLDAFLGPDAALARDAVNRLEMTGDPIDLLVHDSKGRAYELIGRPSGAVIRLVLRDAEFLDTKLKDAADRVTAADMALQEHQWEQETLSGLIEEAPIIAWHRTAEGDVNWSGGEIKVRNSAIVAAQAVDLIVARTRLNRMPVLAGQPQKSRIEIVVNDGADTLSLHVLEIVRKDGSRIGFATDAGTAASAERTLTRFVQTMTETFAHLTVGLAIFDRNQTLALFNPALVQMWQVEPAWLARRPSLRDIIDELRSTRRLPELQDFHKWRTRILGLFENTEAADYEELWHLADGSNIRVLARPHPHGSLAFIFDDVTERVRLEQRYRHSIDLRRATLDRVTEGVAVFGANGLLQFVNQAFHDIWGTDGETIYAAMHARQLVGLCEDLTIDSDIWNRLHSFITGEESRMAWSDEVTMGSGRRLLARIAPLPDGSTMAVFDDVTLPVGRQQLPSARAEQEALQETIKARIETAMSAVTSQESDAIPALEEALGTLTRMTQSDAPAPFAPSDGYRYDISDAISSTIATLAARAEGGGITLTGQTENAPADARYAEFRVRQVLFNLTSEALRVVGSGGSVMICADGTSDDFEVRLVLTGTALEVAPLEDSTALAIAKRFAARDGGEIVVETDPDGATAQIVCTFRLANLEVGQDETGNGFGPRVHQLTRLIAG